MAYVSACDGENNAVVYTDDQGGEWTHTGGSRAWRNNNPGNIIKGSFCEGSGGIGGAGRFGVFPDHATGFAAIKKLLRTSTYKALTIEAGITKYAPPVENDTESYKKKLKDFTGLELDLILGDLTDEQMTKVASAIQRVEGWIVGKVTAKSVASEDRGSPGGFELATMSEDMLYEHLRQVWKRAQERFGLTGDAAHDFQEGAGKLNLIGARGLLADTLSPVENRSNAWDDTMFVVYKDSAGAPRVDTFYLSTEPNDAKNPTHVSTLKAGMHRYWLSFHHISSTHKHLDEYLEKYPGKDYKYRALKPVTTGVTTFLDADHDLAQAVTEKEIADNAINIHYGGSAGTPSGWSHGCQVLKGPKGYRDFVALVESDHSIIGSIDNELDDKPTADGTRYVIYLLVEGTYLSPPGVTSPIAGLDVPGCYELNEGGAGGFFPVGANNFWHGGVHLDAGEKAVCAIADGDVVAYRIGKEPLEVALGAAKLPMSNGFVLIRHERTTPLGQTIELFSLYMHLLPLDRYTQDQKGAMPAIFKTHEMVVATAEDGRGLNIRSAAAKEVIVAVIPKDAHFEATPGASAPWDKSGSYTAVNYEGKAGYAYLTGRATKVSGSTYVCTVAEDWPEMSKRGLNVREAGKGTRVTRVAPKGEKLTFKKPHEVAPGGSLATGWHELDGGGWVYVRGSKDASVTLETLLEPEAYDKVVSCKIPVTAGAVIGYPGPYLTRPATVHVEVLAKDVEHMSNPKGDTGGQGTLQITAGKSFKIRKEQKADVPVKLPVGSRLRLLDHVEGSTFRKVAADEIVGFADRADLGEYNEKGAYYELDAPLSALQTKAGGGESIAVAAKAGDRLRYVEKGSGTNRKVAYTLTEAERDEATGWIGRDALGDYSAATKRYTLKQPLAALYKESPDKGFSFDEDAGQNEEEIFTDALPPSDSRVCKDKEGKLWQEVAFAPGKAGWIKLEQDGVKVTSPYDWARWRRVEESGSYSEDGLCDVPEILKLLDADQSGEVTASELKDAYGNPEVARKLRFLACKHGTEWAGEIKGIERLKEAPWHLSDEELDATKEYVKQLGFWADAKDAGLPDPASVWHLHPLGLVEQLRAMTTGAPPVSEKRVEPVKPKQETLEKVDPSKPKPQLKKPDPEKPGLQACTASGVDDVAAFFRAEMVKNAGSKDVEYIRENLDLTWTEAVIPFQATIDTIQAYYRWYELVKPGGPWDHKALVRSKFGNWSCDFPKKTHYNYDVWSNIHYGYVGLAAGFSRATLLDGAGVAQLITWTVPDGYWSRRLAVLGDADVFRALDDPADQEAIRVGCELWEKHKKALTKEQLKAAAQAHAVKLQTEPCGAQKAAEKKPPASTGKAVPLALTGSVGAGGDNVKADVKRVRERLVALGFDWLEVKETSDDTFVAAIRLFQSIVGGRQTVSGDGRVDKDGDAHKWLQASNAPRWQLLTASGTGYENYERADTSDTHDYGASWLNDFIIAAGAEYQKSYRSKHAGVALMSINDASLPRGGDTKDHKGHEAGLDIDVRLPKTDGTTGGITYSESGYDRDTMRAILKAFRAQALCDRVFFNDPTLIGEGLCKAASGHANHAHVGMKSPAREGA